MTNLGGVSGASQIFEPLHLGSQVLKNRVAVTAHTYGLLDGTMAGSDAMYEYVRARLVGGVGLIVLGETRVGLGSSGDSWGAAASSDDIVGLYKRLQKVAHSEGAVVLEQLFHPGGQVWHEEAQYAYAPSAVPHARSAVVPVPMSVSQISDAVSSFRRAAKRVQDGGIGGVELKCDQGKLLHQFLSGHYNRRTDSYGGGLIDRTKFIVEVLEAIREELSPRQVLGIRLPGIITNSEGVQDLSLDDCLAVVTELEGRGLIDYVSVSGESNSTAWAYRQSHGDETFSPMNFRDAGLALHRTCNLPVLLAGNVRTLAEAEQALQSNICDVVGMTRAHIAEPGIVASMATPSKAARPCVSCNQGCIGNTWYGNPIRCTVNPTTGREATIQKRQSRTTGGRSVVVVGAGPSGLEFAFNAAGAGHRVQIYERSQAIGGRVRQIAKLPLRSRFGLYLKYLEDRLASLESAIAVHLGSEVTDPADLLSGGADALVLASGGLLSVPVNLQGSSLLLTPEDVLDKETDWTGQRVAVIDSERYNDALGVAMFLVEQGAEVHVHTPFDAPGLGLDPVTLTGRLAYLTACGVRFETWSELVGVRNQMVSFRSQLSNAVRKERYSSVVYVGNPAPAWRAGVLENAMRHVASKAILLVGDAKAPSGLGNAVSSGFDALYELERIWADE